MLTRDQLHRLIDTLSDEQLVPLGVAAEKTAHPALLAALRAPLDDEPESEDEREAVAEAREAYARGEIFTHEEIKRRHAL